VNLCVRPSFLFLIAVLFTAVDGYAQEFYYGRNKVQYTDFKWMILKTKHFDIYYYPEMKDLAERGAFYAEESYKILENKFNHTISNKIPLIFYSTPLHFQQTNIIPVYIPESVGGFFEYFKGRVVIPFDGSSARFRKTIQHELVHVFTHSKLYWLQKDQDRIRFYVPPLWFTEGLAELWSSESNAQSEMVIVDRIIENKLIPIQKISSIEGSYLMYKEGESFLRFIEKTYGSEKIVMIMEYFVHRRTFEDVFRFIFGKNFKQLGEEWATWLKQQYQPLIDEQENSSKNIRIITKEGFNEAPAYYCSKNNDYVYYISNITGYTNIVAQPLEESDEKPNLVIKGERTQTFESIHFLNNKIDINGDGELTFVTKCGETDVLYIYDLNTNKLKDSFKFSELVGIFSPEWSHSSEYIAFSGINRAGSTDIYVLNVKIRRLSQQTDDYYDDRNPSWSPDDRLLVFSSDRNELGQDGVYKLFLKQIDTPGIYQITGGNQSDDAPVWSTDGKYIAFTSERERSINVCMMEMQAVPSDSTLFPKGLISTNASSNPLASIIRDSSNRIPDSAYTFYSIPYIPGRIKQITLLSTGAFNPEFTAEGGILFSCFERYSYQIRYIVNAIQVFNENPVIGYGVLKSVRSWQARKISIIANENAEPYKKKYSFDIAQGQIASESIYGSYGGAQFLISDMLGNDLYYLLLYNNAQVKEDFYRSFNFSFSRISLKKRTNFDYGVFHFSGRRYNLTDFFYNERYYGGFFGIRYPLSAFQRVESGLTFGRSEKDKVIEDQIRIALLSEGYVSYVKDNSLWGITGPMEGERYLVLYGKTKDIMYNNVNYNTFMIDFRKYMRFTPRTSFAVRLMSYVNKGKEAQRFYFGGSWDLRGYRLWRIWGQEINFLSTEYRFPILDWSDLRFPTGGMRFGAVRGALFFDIARINDSQKDAVDLSFPKYPKLLGSTGIGIRYSFLGAVVLRLDIGRCFEDDVFHFTGKTFTKFFFGWDF
jgi:hypothetical protein